KYLDWENKQLIVGISEDFPELVAEVENAINYPLSISGDCFQTTEKFSAGVSLCGLTVGLTDDQSSQELLSSTVVILESQKQEKFVKSEEFSNKEGYWYNYLNSKVCQFAHKGRFYFDCAFGVREANKSLAPELISEEALNARKDEILRQLRSQQ
ncbi:MAG: hypothetical protein ACK5L6_11665, partial [Anaerorhabdus sp.]|uniref:hypothetical protein n=1 Tax=Anaerorhabdus sp. TaxID=1872524 RepID=UPI003A896603